MALNTQYTTLKNLRVDLLFNEPEGEQYRPLVIRAQAEVLTVEGAIRNLYNTNPVGNLTAIPLTAKQIYTQMGNVTNLHTQVRNTLKQLYLDAINDDISV